MKKAIALALILGITSLGLSGCESIFLRGQEINDSRLLNIIGLDKVPGKESIIRITTSSREMVAGGGGSGGGELPQPEQKSQILTGEGRSIIDAISNLYTLSEKTPFMGHVEYILIGEEAAKEGLLEYLDFFFRYYEIRLNLKVFIVKGTTAEDMMTKVGRGKGFLADKLKSILNDKWAISISDEVKVLDVMAMLEDKYSAGHIPSIALYSPDKKRGEDTEGKWQIRLDGYAVFKGEKLKGFIANERARGLNWARNKVRMEILGVKGYRGQPIAIEVISSKVKIKPIINNGEPEALIDVEFISNIAEVHGTKDPFTAETIKSMEEQQERIVKGEIEKALSYAQENNLDFFPISDVFFHRYPVKWDRIKGNWDNIFPGLKVNIRVKSEIQRSYDIREPIDLKGDER